MSFVSPVILKPDKVAGKKEKLLLPLLSNTAPKLASNRPNCGGKPNLFPPIIISGLLSWFTSVTQIVFIFKVAPAKAVALL